MHTAALWYLILMPQCRTIIGALGAKGSLEMWEDATMRQSWTSSFKFHLVASMIRDVHLRPYPSDK